MLMDFGSNDISLGWMVVFEKIASSIIERFGHLFGYQDSIKRLQFRLPMIQAVLEDAEERQVTEKTVKIWLSLLKDVAQDAEDLLDRLSAEIMLHENGNQTFKTLSSQVLASFSSRLPFSDTANELKSVLEVLDMTVKEGLNLHLTEHGIGGQSHSVCKRESGSFAIESEIYGRGEDKEKLVELLLSINHPKTTPGDVTVIPIVGMGGIGKTTLAQLAYNSEKVAKHFDLKMWVFVSDVFQVRKIITSVIESATSKRAVTEMVQMDLLQSRLQDSLRGKRYLLVLDDVWNEDHDEWDKLRTLFKGFVEGSKIMVTTRSEKVAFIMGTTSTYYLKGLSEDDCWTLFKKRAFHQGDEDEHPGLLPIGKHIVKKCGGVPLAVKTLGSLMLFKRQKREWLFVQNSDLWNLSECQKGLLPALRLSYHHLPPHLKQCFVYCSVFPKNFEIKKDKLILLWMAEGLIISDGERQFEDIGEEYFNDLLWMSFLQEARQHEHGKTCVYKMHELIYDLAQSIGGSESLILGQGLAPSNLARTRHSSIVCNLSSSSHPELLYEAKHLRTLLLLFPGDISDAPPNMFSLFKYLRVLDLSGTAIIALQQSVGSLACLRYLDLSNTRVRELPETICNLYYLQTLNLSGCYNLIKLPRMMKNMMSLRHLNIARCHKLTRVPASIGNLIHLQTLPIFIVSNHCDERIVELGQLNLRGELRIKNLEKVSDAEEARQANLMLKENLHTLGLSWWNYRGSLNTITETKQVVLPETEQLHFKEPSRKPDTNVPNEKVEDIFRSLQPHHNLKRLSVDWYPGFRLPQWILPNLTAVEFTNCGNLTHLPTLGHLPSLKTLYLQGMNSIRKIGQEFYGRRSQMPFLSLKELILKDFPNLEVWSAMDNTDIFPNLGKLVIHKCPNLTATPLFSSLHHLELQECNSNILSSMENLTSLHTLELKAFQELSFIPGGLLKTNSLLTSLRITSCHNLNSLPSELENLAALESLTIHWCEKLSSLPQGLQNLRALESLEISECTSLVSLPDGIGDLISLQTLSIENCSNLASLPTRLHNLTALEHLTIMYCPSLSYLPEGMRWLCALRSLYILGCPKLSSMPEELQHVTTLQSLEIHSCPRLSTLPEWIENFSSLRSLAITDCSNLVSLPKGLQGLTALQHISILDCPNLEEICKEGSVDWRKIAHIPHKRIGSTRLSHYSAAGSSSI